jgi:hypothetical protein
VSVATTTGARIEVGGVRRSRHQLFVVVASSAGLSAIRRRCARH